MKEASFVTFEGNEGVGKTTQISLVSEALKMHNVNFVRTREPGGTFIAENIRRIILTIDNKGEEMDPKTEVLLFAAARAQHYEKFIKPSLNDGKMVICDRFLDSSIAYQGYGRKGTLKDIEKIYKLSLFAIGGEKSLPNLTICLLLDPVLAFERKGGADKNDRMEQESIDFHNRIYSGFVDMAKKNPNRFVTIDASKTIEEVNADIVKVMKERLPELKGIQM